MRHEGAAATWDLVLFLFRDIACCGFGIIAVKKYTGLNDSELVGNSQGRNLNTSVQILFMKPQFFIRQVKLWPRGYSRIDLYLFYGDNLNTAYFDDVQLIKDNSPSYVYDDEGNLTSAQDAATANGFTYNDDRGISASWPTSTTASPP